MTIWKGLWGFFRPESWAPGDQQGAASRNVRNVLFEVNTVSTSYHVDSICICGEVECLPNISVAVEPEEEKGSRKRATSTLKPD